MAPGLPVADWLGALGRQLSLQLPGSSGDGGASWSERRLAAATPAAPRAGGWASSGAARGTTQRPAGGWARSHGRHAASASASAAPTLTATAPAAPFAAVSATALRAPSQLAAFAATTATAAPFPPPAAPAAAAAPAGGAAALKAEVGRATWTLLHSLAAQFPDRPSRQQQRDARALVDCLTRIYPCGDCARHFAELVRREPPAVRSGADFRRWLCRVHNAVNARLGKPAFNCELIDARWAPLGCAEEEGAHAAAAAGAGCELLGTGSGRGAAGLRPRSR